VSDPIEIRVPDIGDFTDVPVIELLVEPGQEIAAEDPLVALESDKATMEVPAPEGGTVQELLVAVGDKVSEGTPLLRLTPSEAADGAAPTAGTSYTSTPETDAHAGPPPPAQPAPPSTGPPADADHSAQVVVLGAGPGGYSAAFRAADLGLKTILIERYESLGGVCLNVGCIPSKALLHLAKVITEAEETSAQGLKFAEPEIDLDQMRTWKDAVVGRLTGGLGGLAKQRKIDVLHGVARFTGPNALEVGGETVGFEHCIIAVGSSAARLPFLPDDPRIMTSTEALELEEVPDRLLVIGGGVIGLEMATVYDALGSRITVVELQDQLIPGCDPDLVRPLHKRISGRYEAIHLKTSVTAVEAADDGLHVTFDGDVEPATFDRILLSVGRRPNGGGIGAEAAGVAVDERGFIRVDDQQRTNVPHILAIGDVVGEPMLAHKASHEGHVAAEVVAGHDVAFDANSIPAVAYTDPEVAWTGLTETQARAQGVEVDKAVFPWAASGRALSSGRDDGITKVILDPESRRVLGYGMVGINAGELIAEGVHAIEMGSDVEDLALTIHPHPTLSETVGFAAEMAAGTITDVMPPRKRR
jgi:dihydrolipoamide dehydrogenase